MKDRFRYYKPLETLEFISISKVAETMINAQSLFNGAVMLDRLIQNHENIFLNSSHYPNPSRAPDNFILIDQHGIVLSAKDEIVDRGVCVFAYLDLRCYKRVQAAIKIANADTPTIINVQYTLHGVPYDSEIHILKHGERYLGIIWRTPNLIAFNPR
jgi:hypothetical protein